MGWNAQRSTEPHDSIQTIVRRPVFLIRDYTRFIRDHTRPVAAEHADASEQDWTRDVAFPAIAPMRVARWTQKPGGYE